MIEIDKWEDIKNNFPYLDILYLEHPTSKKHERQSMESRAGQFSPYAALTGYEEDIKETVRKTDKEIFLTEDEREKLDEKFRNINNDDLIRVIYFIKDKRKDGGKYLEKEGYIKKIDNYHKLLIFHDKEKVPIKDIVNIDIITTLE